MTICSRLKAKTELQHAKKAENLKLFFSDIGEEGYIHVLRLDRLQDDCISNFVNANYGGCHVQS